ncbi:MAG: sugar transferase [Dehalococcoidia bacterium]
MQDTSTVVHELAADPAVEAASSGMSVRARPAAPAFPGARSLPQAVVLRALDIIVATMVLIATFPFMIVLAVMIRRDSAGPALFVQHRLARGERTFRFVKFRTMVADARTRFPELYAYHYSEDEVRTLYFKTQDDPRLTRVGRWLRKTSLDELPNFINVLLGQMTLVGPRPEIPEMLPYYSAEQRLKFTVKPGITGPAQINGRGLLSFQDTVGMDCRYVTERSLLGDLKILCRTARAIVHDPGAF